MELGETPFEQVAYGRQQKKKRTSINMNDVVGSCNILFLCLDTLRYDVAKAEEEAGNTPVLNQFGPWQKCQAPGNFTYPSHHAMFAGFLPCPYEASTIMDQEMLFFPKNAGMGKKGPEGAYCFSGPTFVQGLAEDGYLTCCIGGVSFFDKRSDLGKIFPAMFQYSYWNPSFGCQVKESIDHQIAFAVKKLAQFPPKQHIMMYLNVDAIHYPNYFYLPEEREDNIRTHAAALRYVDSRLQPLFDAFCKRGPTFVICCSDHGTCYGEDGRIFHGLNHPMVNTIPYKHFFVRT